MSVQIPSNQCLRFFGSSTWLSALIIAWGIVSGLGCLISGANGYIVQVCSSCNTHTFLTDYTPSSLPCAEHVGF